MIELPKPRLYIPQRRFLQPERKMRTGGGIITLPSGILTLDVVGPNDANFSSSPFDSSHGASTWTIPSGESLLLYVLTNANAAIGGSDTVTWGIGAQALSIVPGANLQSGSEAASIWYVKNPNPGTSNITYSNSGAGGFQYGQAFVFKGGLGNVGSGADTAVGGGSGSLNVSSAVGHIALFCLGFSTTATIAWQSGGSGHGGRNNGSHQGNSATYAGASTVNGNYTTTTATGCLVGCDVS